MSILRELMTNEKVEPEVKTTHEYVLDLKDRLLLHWKGSFAILDKVRGDDYRIQLVGRTETFHANMLQKYWSSKT